MGIGVLTGTEVDTSVIVDTEEVGSVVLIGIKVTTADDSEVIAGTGTIVEGAMIPGSTPITQV